jgi:hypothetical protein
LRARRAITVLVAAAIICAIALTAYANLNSTIMLSNPRVDDSLQYSADLTFPGVADFSLRGSCSTVNRSTTCDLSVLVATSTDAGGPNFGLATKTITLELQNSPFSQLAIASGQNAFPVHATYSIINGDPANKVATIDLPAVSGGATWSYDFLILNPPLINGKASLNLIVGAQLVPTGIFGHSYDLEAQVQLPSS